MGYETYRIKSVQRSLRLLKLFNEKRQEISLKEFSEELKIHKSTAYRIAMTLCEEGFLYWNSAKGTYSLGFKIVELGAARIHGLELRAQARPHLEKMYNDLGEIIHLGVLTGGSVVYIDKVEGKRGLTLYSEVGFKAPVHCTALGKVLLAGLTNDEVTRRLKDKNLKRFTSRTIVTLPALLRHLEEVRENGYALDLEEHESMVYCVAAPIRDYSGKVIAALSVTTIIKYFADNMLDKYIKTARRTAANVSLSIGSSSPI